MLDKQSYMHVRECTRPDARVPTRTHTQASKKVFISFPRQQWFHERASVLRYTYIACLV